MAPETLDSQRCGAPIIRLLALVAVAIIALLPVSPLFQVQPARDSGAFLYGGWRILSGAVPYRDFWDHKGPLIFYVDAVGLFIGGGSRWGVWLVECFALALAGIFGYRSLRRAFGHYAATIASLIWMLALPRLLEGGNFTEEYALPLAFAALLLFERAQTARVERRPWRWVLIGVTLGLAVLLRPNNAGVQLTIGLVVIVQMIGQRDGAPARRLVALLAGTAVALVPALIFFALHGSLGSFYFATVTYNFQYASFVNTMLGHVGSFAAILLGWWIFAYSGVIVIVLAAWAMVVAAMVRGSERCQRQPGLHTLLLIGLPVETYLATLSGRAFMHYYVMWLPVFAALAGYFLARFAEAVDALPAQRLWLRGVLRALLPGIIIVLLLVNNWFPAFPQTDHSSRAAQIGDYLRAEESLLMWGAEAGYNFLLQTPAPTRFAYQYPLFAPTARRDSFAGEFTQDVARARPVIVDTSSTNVLVPPLDVQRRRAWQEQQEISLSPALEPFFSFVDARYTPVATLQPSGWTVYRYAAAQSP